MKANIITSYKVAAAHRAKPLPRTVLRHQRTEDVQAFIDAAAAMRAAELEEAEMRLALAGDES